MTLQTLTERVSLMELFSLITGVCSIRFPPIYYCKNYQNEITLKLKRRGIEKTIFQSFFR